MSFLMPLYLGLIENVNHLPYKSLPSDSHYQYILEKGESGRSGESGGCEERNKRKSQSEEKSGSRKKQKRSKKKFTLKIPEYLIRDLPMNDRKLLYKWKIFKK